MASISRLSLLLLGLLVLAAGASAFKQQDFKTCAQAGFCNRNRGSAQGQNFEVAPNSVVLNVATLSATLVNTAADNKHLQLTLTPHADGFLRLLVDESPSVGRYQVPSDVIVSGWENKKSGFTQTAKDASSLTVTTAGDTTVTLSFKPFKLAVSIKGQEALAVNSRNLFNFEHRRNRTDTDPPGSWEESFNGHTDTKPKGPEAMSLDLAFPGFQNVYGLPERATALSLKATNGAAPYNEPYRLYNLDVFEYLEDHPFGLYGSIPMMLAHKKGLTTAVFWLNAAEMFVDVVKERSGVAAQWIAESGVVDLYVFTAGTPEGIMASYAKLTGTTALPQLFSIGYHQCRWNYKDQADVKQVDAGFDEHEIPYDVLWLDIEHTNGKRYLTWDKSLFPEPIKMQVDVASRGRKMVTIVDPHVKRDHSYYIFSEAEKAGHYVKNKHNSDFDGWCWPGSSSYLDVTSPVVREWWAQQFTLDKYEGSTRHLYIWNDMNEPSVFNGPEITMHKDNLHYGGVEHRDVHNLYGVYYHMGTAEGLKLRGSQLNTDGDRPFVLSRAFYAGTQRVGPIWTGDNAAQWSHLKVSVPMLLTLGITGLPYSGADVGGFFGNPDAELMTRWYQAGAYYPFFRGHAHLETQRREPWLFGPEATARIRDAIRSRYSVLPYLYTLFRFANTTGLPILRPLWYEFPDQEETFAADESFMVGSGMLVHPVMTAGASSVDVLLPKTARWYNAITGAEMPSQRSAVHRVKVTIEGIPVFYRGGAIVPRRERPRRSTATMARDPFTLIVALDNNKEAEGSLYVDDGSSFAFQKGAYVHRAFSFKGMVLSSKAHQEPGVPAGTLQTPTTIERVVFLGLPAGKKFGAKLPGMSKPVELEHGPTSPKAPLSTHAYVLRKPDLPVAADWSVTIVAL